MASEVVMSDTNTCDDMETTLYYFEHSSPSRKVLVALYEKDVKFRPVRIDLIAREQHERWYLEKVSE